ncbi:hypothetical protein [Runella sp.]|uniref:hypothetical protein n=1 Tax=Runella sp. TaxID=1960881 RepID=UPI003D0DCDB3
MNKQLELIIARLERANVQLRKLLESYGTKITEEEVNEILDEILKNEETIEKLKKGL